MAEELRNRMQARCRPGAVRRRQATDAANEAKSALLAAMSHEVRTPISSLIAMSGLMLGTALNADQRELARTMFDAAARTARTLSSRAAKQDKTAQPKWSTSKR